MELLLRGGQIFLDVYRQRQDSTREDEEVSRKLQLLNAQTQTELVKVQEESGKAHEETNRLKVLLDFYTANQGQLDEQLLTLVRSAVTDITRRAT